MKNISFKVGDLPTLIEKHTNQVFCLEREVPQKQQTIKLEEAIKLVTIDANDNSKVVKIRGSLDRIIREERIILTLQTIRMYLHGLMKTCQEYHQIA